MTITKEQFEHEVPAFRTPEPEGESTVWDALQVHLDEALRHVCAHYGVNLTLPAAPEAAPGPDGIPAGGEETTAPEGESTTGEPVGSEDDTPAAGSAPGGDEDEPAGDEDEPAGDEDEPGGDEGEPAPVDLPMEGAALHLVCVRAARHAMAGADLVLTATGFGVVSNQNLAPASTVRVQALAEELRRDESRTADHLAFRLLKDSAWARGEAARRIVSRLMWCPMLLRRHGVATPPGSGREPYDEEYRALIPRIDQAEARLAELISPELYAALVGSRRVRPDYEAEALALDLVTETARNLVAAHLAPPAEPVRLEAWHGLRALSPLIREADFGTYLQLENLFQGFLLTRDPQALDHMARILYPEPTPAPRRRRNSYPEENEKTVLRYSVLNWYAALKRRFAREWPDLFRPAPAGGEGQAPPDMAATMNAELRALTGGDVTREQAVRAVGCWRALEELNAKAREAAEFNKK